MAIEKAEAKKGKIYQGSANPMWSASQKAPKKIFDYPADYYNLTDSESDEYPLTQTFSFRGEKYKPE